MRSVERAARVDARRFLLRDHASRRAVARRDDDVPRSGESPGDVALCSGARGRRRRFPVVQRTRARAHNRLAHKNLRTTRIGRDCSARGAVQRAARAIRAGNSPLRWPARRAAPAHRKRRGAPRADGRRRHSPGRRAARRFGASTAPPRPSFRAPAGAIGR
jgi:hypothetical protein